VRLTLSKDLLQGSEPSHRAWPRHSLQLLCQLWAVKSEVKMHGVRVTAAPGGDHLGDALRAAGRPRVAALLVDALARHVDVLEGLDAGACAPPRSPSRPRLRPAHPRHPGGGRPTHQSCQSLHCMLEVDMTPVLVLSWLCALHTEGQRQAMACGIKPAPVFALLLNA